jgi:hypothetical protein
LKEGNTCRLAATLEPAGTIVDLDVTERTVRIKRGARNGPLPETLSAIPGGPISQEVLQAAIYRFTDSTIASDDRFAAVKAFLNRAMPTITGHSEGNTIIPDVSARQRFTCTA